MSRGGKQVRRTGRKIWALALSALLIGPLGLSLSQPAFAAVGDPQYVSVDKTVDNSQLAPGDVFTYQIKVHCSERSCLDANLTDLLPAGLAGYAIQNVETTPSATAIPRDLIWTTGGVESADAPAVVGADTDLKVDFTGNVTNPNGQGLQSGQSFTVAITLQVPDHVTPGTFDVVNTALVSASNSAPDSSAVTITVDSPIVIDVAVNKAWAPSPQIFNVGAASAIILGVGNASNVPVETLIIQEPKTAADGASALDASNPFTITDFAGFGASTLPPGATAVQVDAYVKQTDGSWAWQSGTPGSAPALPAGVDESEVGGIRLSYTGTAIAPTAAGSIVLEIAQRATERNTGVDLSLAAHTVDNVATGTASVTGQNPVTKTATASYAVNPVGLATSTTKDISPARIGAGESATASISATNNSDIGVNELTIEDHGYFTSTITFGGFSTAPSWPATAASAVVLYYPLEGGAPVSVPFAAGAIPTPPAGPIEGFEIVYTATNGAIAPGSSTAFDFTINTTENATGAVAELATTNTAKSSIVAPNGLTATSSDDAALELVKPAIDVTLKKTVSPSLAVEPGETVVSKLEANLTTSSDYVTAHQIVVEDSWGSAQPKGAFWDGFNLSAISPTQVPADTSLTVEVQGPSGWISLAVFPAQAGATLASMTQAQIVAVLPAGVTLAELTGIRFTFDNANGFSEDTTVTPYVVSKARATLRTGDPVTPAPDKPVKYENTAAAAGTGTTPGSTTLTDDDTATGTAEIVTHVGTGPVGIEKHWNETTVPAQSGSQRSTTLDWKVRPGYSSVTITDPTNPADPANSVFEAFDLVQVQPVASDNAPFSNGWFLKYDTIAAVELYGVSGWQPVSVPTDGWVQNGAFVGYTLTDLETVQTTGVRIVLAENTAARDAAAQLGAAYDPYAPASGTGVAASGAERRFDLTWQLRNKTRPGDAAWVTESPRYNTTTAGEVDNTAVLDAVPIGGGAVAQDTDNDTVQIVDYGPGAKVKKAVTPAEALFVPQAGTPQAEYPTAQFTISANSDSVSRASYVRVTDPATCSDSAPVADCQTAGTAAGALANPFTANINWLTAAGMGNPFNRMNLTHATLAASIPGEVDLGATTVWLLRYDGTDYSTTTSTAFAVNAMSALELADVVGISATFQGTDPAISGGTISQTNTLTIILDTQVRDTIRSTGAAQTLAAGHSATVTNRVFAQSYDPILANATKTGAVADASLTLTGGDLNVDPVKQISPDALTEPTRDDPVTVTVGANQGTNPVSTLSPAEVWVRDDITSSPDFWNNFDFTGLGAVVAPAGSDQVAVDVYGAFGPGGALVWTAAAPTALANAAVPVDAAQYSKIQGVRLSFTRVDGAFFSPAIPAPTWSTTAQFTAQLRENNRLSGDPVTLTGSVENTVTVQSIRGDDEASSKKTSDAAITLGPGTQKLSVNKLANNGNHFAAVGASVPWDLSFTNTGTGFLTVSEVRDALPTHLLYLGADAPVYTPDADGLLSSDVTLTVDGRNLVFTWPKDGRQMAPGETFSIRVMLELQPGLSSGQQAINTMTVKTAETLDSCVNSVGGGSTTGAWAADATTCGTTDYVAPAPGANLFSVKGVRGALDNAYNPSNPAQECAQNLHATGGSYFRSPCVANSVIGGEDDWVLRVMNAGTVTVDELTVFDQLPVLGDQFLISGSDRGSGYRPQMIANTLKVDAPPGTGIVIEATTSAGVCAGTWSNLNTEPVCEQDGEVWSVVDAATDWSQVSGLRVKLDFTGTLARSLASGEFVDVTFTTKNLPASAANLSGAPSHVPAVDSLAWNQFGVKYRNTASATFGKLSPGEVGVHLQFAPIEVVKQITGPAKAYAPDEFLVDVSCTIAGVALDMGAFATVALNSGNGYTQRINGIPLGAACTMTEQGDIGSYGETARSGTPVTLQVDAETPDAAAVPAGQVATIENSYAFSGLSVTKTVKTEATTGSFGPFDFSLSCVTSLGVPVTFDASGNIELEFTVTNGETYTVPENTIPAHALCRLNEVDASAADEIVIVGTNVTDLGDGFASIGVGTVAAEVDVTNGYDAGTLTVNKTVDGDGAALYGTGPFTFTVSCTYKGQELLSKTFELDANASRTFGTFPAGTRCAVDETKSGGANSTGIDATDGIVVIEGPDAADQKVGEVAVTLTNTFDLTSLQVTKTIAGDLAAPGARGQFTVDLSCTRPVDGIDTAVTVPGGATRTLSAPDALSVRYDNLPVGAICELTETKAGGAESTSITVAVDGADSVVTDGTTAAVDLSSTTGPDQATATVTNTFAAVVPGLPDTSGTIANTGTNAGLLASLSALLIAAGVGAGALVRQRRRRV